MLTMVLGGLWHGASWTFVLWGAYHGLWLVAERMIGVAKWFAAGPLRPVGVAWTFVGVCVGWVFFRAQSFADAAVVVGHMAGRSGGGKRLDDPTAYVAAACLGLLLAYHLLASVADLARWERRVPAPAYGFGLAAVLFAGLVLLPKDRATFIYFQF